MTEFASSHVELCWHYVDKGMERLLAAQADSSVAFRNFRPSAPDTNSLHVLAVHCIGNIVENFIEIAGSTPVHRDRDSEFVAVASSESDVAGLWEDAKSRIVPVLAALRDEELDDVRVHPRRGEVSIRKLLLFVPMHLHEHVGHAELTAQLAREAGLS